MSEIKERLTLSLSSPQANKPLDFLLGVLEIESSKGQEQAITIQNICEYYELSAVVQTLLLQNRQSRFY